VPAGRTPASEGSRDERRAIDLAVRFEREFGHSAAGVWCAPGRVNYIGEHTDYNDGFVLPLAIADCAWAAVAPSPIGRSRVRSAQRPNGVEFAAATTEPGDVTGWGAYLAGVFWAVRTAGHPVSDYDVLIDSSVPTGAGLSSSAAIECAVLLALTDLADLSLTRIDLAQLAQTAENGYVGAPTGIMDQLASLCGRDRHLLFIDTRTLEVNPVPFELANFGLELLVIETNTPHALVDGQYAQRRATCRRAAEILGVAALRDVDPNALPAALAQLDDETMRKRVRHVVTENARAIEVAALLRGGADPRSTGPLLSASHQSLRDDYEVSAEQVDVAVDAALRAGAYGARITGGGFGGSTIALIDAGRADAVLAEVAAQYDARGFATPAGRIVHPSQGARRIA
jgi:galactokinase